LARGGWVHVGRRAGNQPPQAEKAITAACDKFIAEVLRPRFLPEARPTMFNYPVAIVGKWHGNKYRSITRYRSDDLGSYEPEFEAPFARLETSVAIASTSPGTATPASGLVYSSASR
jgi:hypothetical protein